MIFPSATVDVTRAGSTVYWSRRVQLEFPSTHDRMMATGVLYDARLFDEANADYRMGDIVTVRAVDGSTVSDVLPMGNKLRVELSIREPGPLEVVCVGLAGNVQ